MVRSFGAYRLFGWATGLFVSHFLFNGVMLVALLPGLSAFRQSYRLKVFRCRVRAQFARARVLGILFFLQSAFDFFSENLLCVHFDVVV